MAVAFLSSFAVILAWVLALVWLAWLIWLCLYCVVLNWKTFQLSMEKKEVVAAVLMTVEEEGSLLASFLMAIQHRRFYSVCSILNITRDH